MNRTLLSRTAIIETEFDCIAVIPAHDIVYPSLWQSLWHRAKPIAIPNHSHSVGSDAYLTPHDYEIWRTQNHHLQKRKGGCC